MPDPPELWEAEFSNVRAKKGAHLLARGEQSRSHMKSIAIFCCAASLASLLFLTGCASEESSSASNGGAGAGTSDTAAAPGGPGHGTGGGMNGNTP